MITFHTTKPIYLYERENRILLNKTNKLDVVQKNQNIHINRDDIEINHSKAVGAFITTWKTTACNEEITIPTNSGSGPYYYSVDWGDGSIDSDLSGDATHRYASPGIYTVTIRGVFPHIFFNGRSGADKIRTVEQWGDIQWTSMKRAFAGCSHLEILATDAPDLSGVTDMSFMFQNATSINQKIGSWDVSNVTNMSGIFWCATSFNQNINDWDVSNAINMSFMFHGAYAFNEDISGWDVGNVTNMSGIFWCATSFNQNINDWDVSNAVNMSFMFHGAYAFNKDISGWDVSNVTDMNWMFAFATSFNQDIGSWNVGKVTNMSFMFVFATSFNQNISDWDVNSVTDMEFMFHRAISFNQNIDNWDVGKVTTMNRMFSHSGLDSTKHSAILDRWTNNTDAEVFGGR